MTQINNLSRRKFIIGGGCMCGASLLLSSCTEVALSERKQLNIMSDDFLYSRTFPAYNNFKSQSKLITGTSEYNQIVDIGFKTRDAINVYYETNSQKNPTSKNQDGIASVMGHEIAHAVARHSAERASTAMVTDLGIMALEQLVLGQRLPQAAGYVRQFGLDLPFNRRQESEADYLGLIFSSLAGYDINESYKVWERMKEDMGGSGPSEFFSTHPSPDNRIKKLKEWIPIVSKQYPVIG